MKRLNKKGFTLVELLAVIVVLALLMVVAAGSIGTALENSKKSALKTEAQKVLTSAAQDAVTENMLDSTKATSTSPLIIEESEGDYMWYIKATVSGGEATIVDYCVIYSGSTTSGVTSGKYSVGAASANLNTFNDIPAPVEKGTNSCKYTKDASGNITVSAIPAS